MISSVRWSQGPEFLWKEEACWPEFQIDSNNAPDDCELKAKIQSCVLVDHDTFQMYRYLVEAVLFLVFIEKGCGMVASIQSMAH